MSGTIRTYQKCPGCGAPFPSSKGDFPIICATCKTQPTKYHVAIWWNGKNECLYHDSAGATVHHWGHAVAFIGDIRSKMAAHKKGRGYFNPEAHRKQSGTSFKSFWERFLKDFTDATFSKVSAIGPYLEYFNDMQMRDITAWHIKEWWRELREAKTKKGEIISDAYRHDIRYWFGRFMRDALDYDVIEKVPKLPDYPKVMDPEIKYLTVEEQAMVFANIPVYDRPIFDFLFITGCRVNEACALQRSDIDRKHGKVVISKTVKRDGSIGIVKNKKRREIPLHAVEHCLKSGVVGFEYIFINKWGRRYSDDYLRDTAYKACDAAGVKRIQLKNMSRHSIAMELKRQGYDAWQISKFLNHSNLKMTERYMEMENKEIGDMYKRRVK